MSMEERVLKSEREISEIRSIVIEHVSKEELVIKTIEEAIRVVVNGKIDKLHSILIKQNEKTDVTAQQLAAHLEKEGEFQAEIRGHMETVKPYLEGAAGLKVIRGLLIWVGGAVVAWAAIKANFKL